MKDIYDPRAKPVPVEWRHEISSWCDHMLASGLSLNTVATRRDHVSRASRAMPAGPWATTTEDLINWAAFQQWAAETRRSAYASLRSFFGWALLVGRTSADPALGLPRAKAAIPCPRPAPDRIVEIAMRDSDPRTSLILRLALDLGLRRAEIAQIHSADLWEEPEGWSLNVHGKGNKDRHVPVPNDLAAILDDRSQGGWLFPSTRHPSGHVSPRYIGDLANRVLPAPWTLHALRHACATGLYADTKDLLLVQQVLGHSSVATTQRYVQLPKTALREAIVRRGLRPSSS